MKQWLLLSTIFITIQVVAQVKEGKVIYERKINMHKDMPPEAEQFKAMVPEFNTSKMELLFNGSQSLFHPVPATEEDQLPQAGGDGNRRVFRFGGGDAETFRDYETELIVESRELGPKKYIIDDTLRPLKWKLEEDTMTILGYVCHKATTTQAMRMGGGRRFIQNADTSATKTPALPQQQPVVAWYTDAIESQAGPENFYGLPGLILKTDLNNGTLVFTATSIQMMDEQMGGRRGPGNGPVIRIEQ